MRKFITGVFFVALIMSAAIFSGCGVSSEKTIKNDFTEMYKSGGFSLGNHIDVETVEIDEFVIEKRDTDKKEKNDTIWVTVSMHDDTAQWDNCKYIIEYHKYTDGGWIIEGIESDSTSDWYSTPIAGISEDDLLVWLYYSELTLGENDIFLTEENMQDMVIHTETVNEKTETIELSLVVRDEVVDWTMNLEATLNFNNYWVLSNLTIQNYEYDYIQGCEFDKSDEYYLDILSDRSLEIDYVQEILVARDDITDFTIESQELIITNWGNPRIEIGCTYYLDTDVARLKVSEDINFYYISPEGWKPSDEFYDYSVYTVEIDSLSLVGKWEGEYNVWSYYNAGDNSFQLEITDYDSETGKVEAIATSGWKNNTVVGQCKMSGTFEKDDLYISLIVTEWLDNGEVMEDAFDAYLGRLYVSDNYIDGVVDDEFYSYSCDLYSVED